MVEGGGDPFPLPVGEPFPTAEEKVTDPIQRVALAAAMSGHLLLGALADLGDHLVGQPDEMEVVDYHLSPGQQPPHRLQIATPRVDRHRLDLSAGLGWWPAR
jgi:hypothetical protein